MFLKLLDTLKDYGQSGQLYGLSPVWILIFYVLNKTHSSFCTVFTCMNISLTFLVTQFLKVLSNTSNYCCKNLLCSMLANFVAWQTCFYDILHLSFLVIFIVLPSFLAILIALFFLIYFIATATRPLPLSELGIVHDEGQVVLATVHCIVMRGMRLTSYLITIVTETILKFQSYLYLHELVQCAVEGNLFCVVLYIDHQKKLLLHELMQCVFEVNLFVFTFNHNDHRNN